METGCTTGLTLQGERSSAPRVHRAAPARGLQAQAGLVFLPEAITNYMCCEATGCPPEEAKESIVSL